MGVGLLIGREELLEGRGLDRPTLERRFAEFERKFASHVAVHMLDPQTLAYALHDSPVGLCAWILERRRAWGDCRGDVESRFSKEHLLTTMMLYWLTDSFVTSVRYYAEAARLEWSPSHTDTPVVGAPTGLSLFRHDMAPGPTDWIADYFNHRFTHVRESGGHFELIAWPDGPVWGVGSGLARVPLTRA